MKRFSRAAGIAISLICLAYVAVKVVEAWQSAATGLAPTVALTRLGSALPPILLGYMTAALAWVALARCLGMSIPPLTGAGIYLTTQIAKYLPGNVGHYAGRVVLSMQRGYPAPSVALSMTVELVLLIAIAALFSLPMLRTLAQRLVSTWGNAAVTGVLTMLLLLMALLGAVTFVAKSRWSAGAHGWVATLRAVVGRPTALARLALAALLLASSIALSCISLLLLDRTPGYFRLPDLLTVVSLYSVAWIAGVLTPGVPAGLGVREAILVEGLRPLLGATEAVTCTLLFRVLTTLADAIVFGIGMLLLRLAADTRVSREGSATQQ